MQEKVIVNDTLAGINGELVRFGEMIPQTENKELKQTLKQFRNACLRKNYIRWQEKNPTMYLPQKQRRKKFSM